MDARALPICLWCRRAPTGDGAIDFNELEMVATMRKEMVAQRAKRSGVGARIKLTADEGEFLCTVTFYANLAHSLTRSP